MIGVGGGGDVVGALAAARFLEFCGLEFFLGGLSWERSVYDPIPGPRKLSEVAQCSRPPSVRLDGQPRELKPIRAFISPNRSMAAALGQEVLLLDINGGVPGVVDGIETAMQELQADLLVGIDVGGDSLAEGHEPGLRSPLADSIMLAAFAELEKRGRRTLWGVFGYGSDGELTVDEIESALSKIAAAGGLLGGWSLTPKIAAELEEVIKTVPTEASAIPVQCFRGAWGKKKIRGGQSTLKLTPLTTLTFFMSPDSSKRLSRPAQAVRESTSLDEANDALHASGIKTELDLERDITTLRGLRDPTILSELHRDAKF